MNFTKTCTECKKELLANEDNYGKEKKGRYGLKSKCRSCEKKIRASKREEKKKYDKERYEIHRESILEKQKKYAKNNKVNKQIYDKNRRNGLNRELILSKKREYYENTKDMFAEQRKLYVIKNRKVKRKYDMSYYQNNKDKKREQTELWRKENKELDRIYKQRYRARRAELEHSFTEEEWYECKNFFNRACAYCGSEEELAQEHFIPVSKGGSYTKNNILPSCRSCSSSKLGKDFLEWYTEDTPRFSEERLEKVLSYLEINKN